MAKFKKQNQASQPAKFFWLHGLLLAWSYFLVEGFAYCMLLPRDLSGLAFGGAWALLLAFLVMQLPKLAGRIVYGITFFVSAGWTIAQTGYHAIFGKMMWIGDAMFAGEGGEFLGDVLGNFPVMWYVGGIMLLGFGVVTLLSISGGRPNWVQRTAAGAISVVCLVALVLLPQAVFLKDNDIWGTHSEYAQSSSYEATYKTMYDAEKVYDICGVYHLTAKDVWKHILYPMTPAYRQEQKELRTEIDAYFAKREDTGANEMTGLLEGKNVILVLMESMDDWLITQEETPTILRLMNEGINFTNFYTPGYGGARTINTEFCVNSGIYLPTNGGYVFDYVTNSFDQSIASQLTANGYSAECFHYNEDTFYSRGVFEPALGYNAYNSFMDYTDVKDELYDDCYLFDSEPLNELFFREGQTFNFIITRSAHLSYVYNEVLSHYALKQYPEYRGMFGHEEIDCARVKAKLVDDMFARLLEELEAHGQLENTVIIGVTDHYTYGFKDVDTMLELSGVEDELMLEKTPCFIWAAGMDSVTVDKTLNTADLLPTVLNLMGIEPGFGYLGQDAFDPAYEGYALFPNGSWVSDGVICKMEKGVPEILANEKGKELTAEYMALMSDRYLEFVGISNLLLTSDYYNQAD